MKVLIIGLGNAGSGIAADLSLKGHDVSVLKTSTTMHAEHFRHVLASSQITLVEKGESFLAQLACVTEKPSEAFATYPDVVIVTTQSLQHESVFRVIAPFLVRETVILLEPGNAGSLLLANKKELRSDVMIAEATSTPVDVRIREPGTVAVLFRNVRNPLGIFPQDHAQEILAKLRQLYQNFYYLGHTLAAALHNPNLIVHTVGCLLSVPRIEHSKGEFWMYKEGFTRSVWNVIQALDAEKMKVLERLGAEPTPYLEMAKIRNAEDLSMDAMEMFTIYSQTGSPKGPASLSTRYVYEDVPKGLVLLESVGSLCGCPTPVTTTMINLAQAYTLENFRAHGSSLENLGLAGRTTEELLTWLRTGKW